MTSPDVLLATIKRGAWGASLRITSEEGGTQGFTFTKPHAVTQLAADAARAAAEMGVDPASLMYEVSRAVMKRKRT